LHWARTPFPNPAVRLDTVPLVHARSVPTNPPGGPARHVTSASDDADRVRADRPFAGEIKSAIRLGGWVVGRETE